jgi:hypothetical protein
MLQAGQLEYDNLGWTSSPCQRRPIPHLPPLRRWGRFRSRGDEAYERMLRRDVKYRFVIDMTTLKS